MKHNFEDRKQNRIVFAKTQAEKNLERSEALLASAKQLSGIIPLGQPILVGHHSEKSHRSLVKKIDSTIGKAFEASDKSAYYAEKAEVIEKNTAIFSDDPEALVKLKEKLQSLQSNQDFMKSANKAIRKKDKEAFLTIPFATEALWIELTTPNVMNHIGFASYSLANNNANIKRIKDRIKYLEKLSTIRSAEITIKGIRVYQNVEANRLQLFFPAIPSEETRKKLKQSGFRWCRTEGAWQRHLTNNGIDNAKYLLQNLD